MIFNDFGFLFLFLPLVLALFFFPWMRWQRLWVLLVGSFVFYAWSGIEYAIVLGASIVWVYAFSVSRLLIGNRWMLALAIVFPAGALIFYKYSGFLVSDVLGLGRDGAEGFDLFRNVILPAGISFFTFQLISFAIDRYRGEIPKMPSLGRFALYISFFPQLVAGPILRYEDIERPLGNLEGFRLTSSDAAQAIALICLGLGAKVLIADTLHNFIEPWRAAPGSLGVATSIYVLIAYSFQIYFDFYGYSLIAIGLGRLFGFAFPNNFARPYEARNPREFWRRWHITLSYWLRRYLYLPLGGNRRYIRNILIVFAICGLWHGAGWTFVIWGLYHGLLVAGYKVSQRWWDRVPALLQILATFLLVTVGWTLFMFDFAGVQAFAGSLVGLGSAVAEAPRLDHWVFLGVAALACFVPHFENMAARAAQAERASYAVTFAYAVLFVVTLLFIDVSQTFIYFRF